jgi:ABC-type branched-subunit amino acid transport system substrate-binding protein
LSGVSEYRLVLAAAALAVATACSLTTVDVNSCAVNSDCSTQFGLGWVCGSDGMCEESVRLARCNATYPEDLLFEPSRHKDTIVFGNLMDQSLATHRARERSARLAIKQANDEGGLQLRKFGIVFCTIEEDPEFDTLTRPEAALDTATYLIDTLGVPAIVGPAASDDVSGVFQVLRDRGSLFISPSATSPALTPLDPTDVDDENPGLLWRTAPPDSLQGAAIAYDMREPGLGRSEVVDTVAIVFQSGAYGAALAEVFAQEFMAAGGPIPEQFEYETDGQRSEAIGLAAQGNFDEVLFVSSQTRQVIEFMDAAAALTGFDGKGLFLSDAAANPDLLMEANPLRFPQVRGTRQAPRNEETDLVYTAFLAAYSAEYGEDVRPFSFTANAFDAAWLLAYGSAWALLQDGGMSGKGIARGLRRLSSGPELEIRATSWNLARQYFANGESIDVSGASGHLDYDPETEETTGRIETWRIEDNEIVGIDTWPPL